MWVPSAAPATSPSPLVFRDFSAEPSCGQLQMLQVWRKNTALLRCRNLAVGCCEAPTMHTCLGDFNMSQHMWKYHEIPIWYSTILEGWIWINIHKSQQVWWWENENIIHSHPSYWLNFEGKSSLFWDPAMLRNTPLDPNGVLLSFPIQEDGPKQPINILGMGVETTDHVWCDALRCPLLQWRHDTQKHEAWSWQGFSSETSWQKECWLVVWNLFYFSINWE